MVEQDLPADSEQAAFGVYIHWPFCLSKCPYCDFNSHVRREPIDEPRFVRAFAAEIAATAARVPDRTVSTIFFGGGTPSLMQPATVGVDPRRDRKTLARCARRRGQPRSQSDQRRSHPLPRLPHRRRQPRLARRPGARRSRARRAWPHAHLARSARCGRHRAQHFRSLLVRSDLCPAAPRPEGLGERAHTRPGRSRRPSLALSTDHRAGHAVCRAPCGGQARHSRRRSRPRALRHHPGDLRRARPAGLRDFQSRAARRRMPA